MLSLVSVITMVLGKLLLGRETSCQKQISVIPIVIGVMMACFGDMSHTALGLFYTCLSVLLSSLKVLASGEMLTGKNELHPVDLLGHMAPLALVQCLIMSVINGEHTSIYERWSTDFNPMVDPYPLGVVFLSGVMSFFLNIASLQANKATSPLTLCIAAHVKQVLLIIISCVVFHVVVTPLNAAGIVVVLIGSAAYSYISILEKQRKNAEAGSATAKPQEEFEPLKKPPSPFDSDNANANDDTEFSDVGIDDDEDQDLEIQVRKIGVV